MHSFHASCTEYLFYYYTPQTLYYILSTLKENIMELECEKIQSDVNCSYRVPRMKRVHICNVNQFCDIIVVIE